MLEHPFTIGMVQRRMRWSTSGRVASHRLPPVVSRCILRRADTVRLLRALFLLPLMAAAQQPLLWAQSLPSIRQIGPVVTVSPAGLLGAVSAVRTAAGGRVIVNDVVKRQLLLLQLDLTLAKVIADGTSSSGGAYTSPLAGLAAFHGDSSLFIDPQSLSMSVVDPHGSITRVLAIPRPGDAMYLVGGPFGTPGFDSSGGMVYRGMPPRRALATTTTPSDTPAFPQYADSAPLYRTVLATRIRTIIAWIRVPSFEARTTTDKAGTSGPLTLTLNPIPFVDAWAITRSGRVVIVRGTDFHVDWVDGDGALMSTKRIPFPWLRLSEQRKQAILDSAQVEADARRGALAQLLDRNPGSTPPAMDILGRPLFSVVTNGPPGDGGRVRTSLLPTRHVMVSQRELPDYYPPFAVGSAVADLSGRLWIRTTESSKAGPIYYVLDDRGEVVDRVQLPFGRMITGFGDDVVYMGVLDDKGARLERAKVR